MRPLRGEGKPFCAGRDASVLGQRPQGVSDYLYVRQAQSNPAERIPGGCTGRLHELGWAATYLCSPYAAYITGHTLVVDGANWLCRSLVMPDCQTVRDTIAPRPKR